MSANVRVDSEVVESGSKQTKSINARVNLPGPVPRDPILEIRNKGTSAWLDASKTPTIPPGTYEFRIRASGIVYDAAVELEGVGEIKRVGGFKLVNGKAVISHGANNFAARNEIIGDIFEYVLDSSVDTSALTSCTYKPTDGSYRFKLKVFGPDNTEATTASAEVNVKVHDDNEAITDEVRDYNYSNLCTDKCPYVGPVNEFVGEIENVQLSKGEYGDMTFFFRKVWAPAYGVQGMKKLCVNYEKPAAAFAAVHGRPPLSLADIDSDWLAYTKYQEYMIYELPSCNRKLLFARGACGCFAEKTEITLGDGVSVKAINEITYDDKIWNPLTKKAYAIRKITKGPEKLPMIKIVAAGKDITVTGKHPFPSRDGFRTAHNLDKGDEIRINDKWVKVESIMVIPAGVDLPNVYNIELEADNTQHSEHNLLANGIVTGDLFIQTILDQDPSPKLTRADLNK